jgi:hypothetical protein
MTGTSVREGVIRGNSIDLTEPAGLPDGQKVSVVITVRPADQQSKLPPGEGLRTAFGAWSDDQQGLDQFLVDMRRARDADTRTRPTE